MPNEVAQWAAIGLVGFLLLGVLRQVTLLAPVRRHSTEGGPVVGKKLPAQLLGSLSKVVATESVGTTLVFVTENCPACARLLSNLESSQAPGSPTQELAIVARKPSPGFESALDEAGFSVVADREGDFWGACAITATPLVVRIDSQGRVLAKEVTQDVTDVVSTSSAA